MKILHISPQVEPEVGGIATFTSRLVEGLSARGHVNSVVVSHGRLPLPDQSSDWCAPVHRLPFYFGLNGRDARTILRCKLRLSAIKRAFAPDLVHLHIGGPMAFLHLATEHDAQAPLVVTVYDLPPDPRDAPTILTALDHAARIAAVSDVRFEDIRRSAPSVVACCRRIYSVLPRPADEAVSGPSDGAGPDEAPLLLTGGRLVPEKGFHVAIDALARVRTAHPGATLTITGDGPMRADLVEHCRARGLDGAVHLTGRLTPAELAVWRRRAWIALVPTRESESFGLVALEAMHAARPVVASRVGGLCEVVADGETGTLVPPGDPEALANAVLDILADPATMRRMGQRGLQRARTLFDWSRCLDDYERLFAEARP